MKSEEYDILEKKFRYYEKKSSFTVLVLFGSIILIHLIDPTIIILQYYVKFALILILVLILGFIIFEFLKELFFPLIAKFYFKDDQ